MWVKSLLVVFIFIGGALIAQEPAQQEVLDYWFGQIEGGSFPAERASLWFGGSVETDCEIRQHFGRRVEEAASGHLNHWKESVHGKLALIVLLDQFSRNIYRGSSRAFAQDAQARSIAFQMIHSGEDLTLTPIERLFVYMPLMHSESVEDQEISVALFAHLATLDDSFQGSYQYALDHREAILRDGCFLGRAKSEAGGDR